VEEYYKIIWEVDEEDSVEESLLEDTAIGLGEDIVLEEVKHYDRRFGNRTGEIVAVALTNDKGQKSETYRGGVRVLFSIAVKCHERIDLPLAGFVVRDLVGNELIKTNTDKEKQPLNPCPKGSIVQVTFSLVLPHLRTGSYAISAGFGNGTLEQHCAYDWIENISVFTLECPDQCYGLLKAPVEISQKFIENNG
jgi:hypothetical protein